MAMAVAFVEYSWATLNYAWTRPDKRSLWAYLALPN